MSLVQLYLAGGTVRGRGGCPLLLLLLLRSAPDRSADAALPAGSGRLRGSLPRLGEKTVVVRTAMVFPQRFLFVHGLSPVSP